MALLKSDRPSRDAKSPAPHSSPLARVMREFEELVESFEAGLLRSLADDQDGTAADTLHLKDASSDRVRREACRLAISDLSNKYTPTVSVELALNDSFFVADSEETLPYHTFRLPTGPSLQNRGILSRKPEDNGALPQYDSWLLFTFLGNGCIKLEVPIEMCADIYRGRLQGCENEEVLFWGFFVDDEDDE
ncbi:hypothetical protein GGP41_002650 [Bipolaris sorokiniana]|uniref:Uncharacterized protein n=1 Tax=Cochliobolus sativus TaxID=45130 RepID=A0A8H5ZJR9_COCSA|nr:hypothetical protein GGP41_002650 [Bipolaris sorokiniana]